MSSEKKTEFITIHSRAEAEQPFAYSVGRFGSRYLKEMKETGKIMGIRCSQCKKVYIPPREVCGHCFVSMSEPVEVGPQGTIVTYTILRFPFVDPETGELKPVPYGYAYIKLDGSDTCFQHYFTITDESRVKVGARLKPIFRPERKGSVLDIVHFEIIS